MSNSILLIGADSLMGKEIREVYHLAPRLQLATAALDATAVFAASEEEIEVVAAVDDEMIADAAAVIVAANGEVAREKLRDCAAPIIDLTGAIEKPARAIPNAVAALLAEFLEHLEGYEPVTRVIATAFVPASEYGRAGINELQKQTVALLSFKPMPKEIFDAQSAFNFLAVAKSQDSARRSMGTSPPISLRVAQAPVFHGVSASVWVEFASRVSTPKLIAHLKGEGVDVRDGDLDPPDNTGVAGMSGYAAGAIERDAMNGNAAWFWLAADNLRLRAELAVDAAREVI
mgnify:CR=1 FL=1